MTDGSKTLRVVKTLFWVVATGSLLAFVIGKWDQLNEVSAGDFSLRIRGELKPAERPVLEPSGTPAAAEESLPVVPPHAQRAAVLSGDLAHYQQLLQNLFKMSQAEQLQTADAQRLGLQIMAAYQTQMWQALQASQQEQQMVAALLPFLKQLQQ